MGPKRQGKAGEGGDPVEEGNNPEAEVAIEAPRSEPEQVRLDVKITEQRFSYDKMLKAMEVVTPKLNRMNFFAWRVKVLNALQTITYGLKHVQRKIHPGSELWDETYDVWIRQAIASTCDRVGENNVDSTLMLIESDPKSAADFVDALVDEFASESLQASRKSNLIHRMGNIRLYNNDVRKLVADIQAMQAEAAALNDSFSDDTLYAALERETNRHPIYKDAFAGDVGGMAGLRFQALADRLTCRQNSLEATAERPATARVAETWSDEVPQGNQRRPPMRARGRCHRCLEHGHFARECTGQLVVRQPRGPAQPDA